MLRDLPVTGYQRLPNNHNFSGNQVTGYPHLPTPDNSNGSKLARESMLTYLINRETENPEIWTKIKKLKRKLVIFKILLPDLYCKDKIRTLQNKFISDFIKYSIELVKTSLLRAESGKKCPKGLQGPTLFQILRYLFFLMNLTFKTSCSV